MLSSESRKDDSDPDADNERRMAPEPKGRDAACRSREDGGGDGLCSDAVFDAEARRSVGVDGGGPNVIWPNWCTGGWMVDIPGEARSCAAGDDITRPMGGLAGWLTGDRMDRCCSP